MTLEPGTFPLRLQKVETRQDALEKKVEWILYLLLGLYIEVFALFILL